MARIQRWSANLFLLLLSLVFTFVVLEKTIRVYLTRFASDERFLKYASYHQLHTHFRESGSIFTPHRYLGFYPTPDYRKGPNRHNSLGYRGDEIATPEPKNEYRVVCIGGSTTYAVSVNDYRGSYPYLLQKMLVDRGNAHITVVNAGTPSWTTWESLVNFQFRALDLNPDLVVVYHAINDIKPRLVWPLEAYRSDNSGYLRAGDIYMSSIFEHSTLLRAFVIRLGITQSHADIRLWKASPDTYYDDDFLHQKLNQSYPSDIFYEVPMKQILNSNRPIYYKRNLENLIAIAKSRGIGVMLSTFAYLPIKEGDPIGSSQEY